MGDLVRLPHTEVTALLEFFDHIGVKPEHLHRSRTMQMDDPRRKMLADVLNWETDAWTGLGLATLMGQYGITYAHICTVLQPEKMRALADFLRDSTGIALAHVIDCDAAPFVPDGWTVEEHQKGGQLVWNKDAQKDALFLTQGQRNGNVLQGHKLRQELAGKPVLNANVLDYLLAYPDLIPEEWKGKYVFFWGTTYHIRGGGLYVRYFCWGDGRWHWSDHWLGSGWNGNFPAALRAS